MTDVLVSLLRILHTTQRTGHCFSYMDKILLQLKVISLTSSINGLVGHLLNIKQEVSQVTYLLVLSVKAYKHDSSIIV